ncbi:MAG: class I SAM-dependent methyltransferase [Gammaproteobacteria bacterium]
MRLYITSDNPEFKLKVSEVSRKLNIEIFSKPPQRQIKDFSEDYFLIYSKDRLFLKKGLRQNAKPIFSDFDDWAINYDDRLLKNSIKGLPKNFSCIDLTAGFGKDSLEISKSVNCKSLLLLEKEAWVFELLVDGIKKASSPRAINLLKKFRTLNADNLGFLESQNSAFDLIYIDPMFLGVQKSKAKKHMQALRDLSTSINQPTLLKKSIDSANYRVVVKRHKNMEYLEDITPSRSVEGKVVRYDIYNTN